MINMKSSIKKETKIGTKYNFEELNIAKISLN